MDNYIDEKYYKSDVTGKIIKCAQKVHRTLGNGFQEVIYQRSLAIEFEKEGLKFEREKEMDIFYEEQLVGTRRVDFLVDRDVMVELKAITKLEDVNIAQLINYIEAYKVKLGLLINFGARSLEVKRYVK
ncbi:MAG: GxxExxY protein [Candidatus Moranbacteria bacterium]|nr:GxxExxY protein [Candidatus Moranbacteria bacterium]